MECKVWLKEYLDSREDSCEALFVTDWNPIHWMTILTIRYAVKLIAARGKVPEMFS